MEVVSISPFRAGSVLWRPRPDRWTLTVVCKATYALAPGESALAADQEEVHERDAFWDDDPRRSVHTPGDLAPFKPRADVVLVGHAYAPRSEMVRSLVARLLVGEMEKAIEVFCPRVVGREGELREGQRWSKMPLRYEYAAGGLETWNPVGIGATAPADPYGQRPLPNLQPPGLRVTQWRDNFVPTGLGPISPAWRIRQEKLGRRAEGWSDEGWTQVALDDDFDGEFFQVAPPDQQLDALRDDERMVLEYLNPDHPSLTTQLPGVHPHAFVEIPGNPARDLVMTADTLWIDTDRALCTLTWRGQVAVDGPEQPGRVIIAMEEAGQSLHWAALSAPRSGGTMAPEPEGPRREMRTLPFVTPDVGGGYPRPPALVTAPPSVVDAGEAPPRAPVLPTPPPPDSRDDASEPLPTPRRQRTLQAVVDAPPPAPESGDRALGPRQTLQMFPEIESPMPAWVAAVQSPAAESVALPPTAAPPTLAPSARERPRTGASTQVSVHVGAVRAGARPRSFEPCWVTTAPGPGLLERIATLGDPAADLSSLLAHADPATVGLEHALAEAIARGGALSPPILVLRGELSVPFDEVEEVRALITAARPAARASETLAGLLSLAEEMARTELSASPEVAEGLCRSIHDAWAQANQVLPPGHLAQQVERALLFRRAYQRRSLLGRRWVRTLLSLPTEGRPVPAYLPSAAAARLPLFERFPAWLVVEVLPSQDGSEASPVALRIAALARDVTPGR